MISSVSVIIVVCIMTLTVSIYAFIWKLARRIEKVQENILIKFSWYETLYETDTYEIDDYKDYELEDSSMEKLDTASVGLFRKRKVKYE